MRNRRSSEIMRCLSQALGSASSWVAFDALATPVPTACGDLLFFNSKKRKQKMPLSCAERLAQRKALCGSHTMRWPARWVARGRWVARWPCALCAMVLSEGLLGWHFCHGFSECLGNVKGIITKPSHKESKRLKQRSEHPMERNASKLASHKSRATLFVRDSKNPCSLHLLRSPIRAICVIRLICDRGSRFNTPTARTPF